MRFCSVDIGNSLVKVTSYGGDGRGATSVLPSVEEAIGHCRVSGAKAVGFSTTRALSEAEKKTVEEAGWWKFHPLVRLPIWLLYRTPSTLGPDRLAAAVGAWKEFPGETVLIADIGTALTLDLVNGKGEYLGGNISPGIRMRFEALHRFTSRLPLLDFRADCSYFGDDTESAIRAGVKWGIVNEVAGAFGIASKEQGCGLVAVTGGGSRLLFHDIEMAVGQKGVVKYRPELVADGIKTAYEFNHDK